MSLYGQVDVDMPLVVGEEEESEFERQVELGVYLLIPLIDLELVGAQTIHTIQLAIRNDVLALESEVSRPYGEGGEVLDVGREVFDIDVVEYRQKALVVEVHERAIPAYCCRAVTLHVARYR